MKKKTTEIPEYLLFSVFNEQGHLNLNPLVRTGKNLISNNLLLKMQLSGGHNALTDLDIREEVRFCKLVGIGYRRYIYNIHVNL